MSVTGERQRTQKWYSVVYMYIDVGVVTSNDVIICIHHVSYIQRTEETNGTSILLTGLNGDNNYTIDVCN